MLNAYSKFLEYIKYMQFFYNNNTSNACDGLILTFKQYTCRELDLDPSSPIWCKK